jgi:hypothetical protein
MPGDERCSLLFIDEIIVPSNGRNIRPERRVSVTRDWLDWLVAMPESGCSIIDERTA